MCGASDNRAAQMSLTLTLSPYGARESDEELKKGESIASRRSLDSSSFRSG